MGTLGGIWPYPLKAAGLRSLSLVLAVEVAGGQPKLRGGGAGLGSMQIASFITFTIRATRGRPSENNTIYIYIPTEKPTTKGTDVEKTGSQHDLRYRKKIM